VIQAAPAVLGGARSPIAAGTGGMLGNVINAITGGGGATQGLLGGLAQAVTGAATGATAGARATPQHRPHAPTNTTATAPAPTQLTGDIANLVRDLTPLLSGIISPESISAVSANPAQLLNLIIEFLQRMAAGLQAPVAVAQSLGIEDGNEYSDAKFAFLAALPALMPLVEKVASPDMVNAIGDQPGKGLKAIGDVMNQGVEAGLKVGRAYMDGAERMNPGLGDANAGMTVLAAMSIAQEIIAQSRARTSNNQYSETKFAPLLAALPALMPLVEKVASPEMVNAIGDQPGKGLKAIGDFMNQGVEAGLKVGRAYMDGAERMNPGLGDANAGMTVLAAMSVAQEVVAQSLNFQPDTRIKLEFIENTMVSLGGREKIVYNTAQNAVIKCKLTTDHPNPPSRPIPKVIVQLLVQNPHSLKVLLDKRFNLKNVQINAPIDSIVLTTDDLKHLPSLEHAKILVNIVWQGKSGAGNIGVSKSHYICFANGYIFDKLENTAPSQIALNDTAKYRAFWHKVWEGGLTETSFWNIKFDINYHYHLDTHASGIGKMETRKKMYNDNADTQNDPKYNRNIAAKLKSGMELTPDSLNQLLGLVGKTPLNPQQLAAMRSHSLKKLYHVSARTQGVFKGKSGETCSLWVYPDVSIDQFSLLRITQTNASGQATAVSRELVQFPRLTAIHFIGTKSE
jgi:hypothetical protein